MGKICGRENHENCRTKLNNPAKKGHKPKLTNNIAKRLAQSPSTSRDHKIKRAPGEETHISITIKHYDSGFVSSNCLVLPVPPMIN
jgi:hypothetical protein